MQEECLSYNYNLNDFLIPPQDIFNYLCSSHDKTYLFIISLTRVIILSIIAQIFYNSTRATGITLIIHSIFLIYIIINVIILFLIIFKKINK